MDIDPAAVMAAHEKHTRRFEGPPCCFDLNGDHCDPWHVAEVLAVEQAKVARTEAVWLEGCRNDGDWEYTEASDCDGTHLAYRRRHPALSADAESWQSADEDAFSAARYPEQHRAALADLPKQN